MRPRHRYAPILLMTLLWLLLPPGPAHAQALELRTPYTVVRAEPGRMTTFDLEVVTSTPRRVDLDVPELPDGWTATFRGGGFVVESAFGDPDAPPPVQLHVTVARDAAPGDHRVVVRGRSGATVSTLVLVLRVEAAGGEGAVSLTADGADRLAAPGEQIQFELTLENNSGAERLFALEAEAPDAWDVRVHPSAEPTAAAVRLEPGGSIGVQASITVPEDAVRGVATVQVRADDGEGLVAEQDLEVVVEIADRVVFETSDERLSASVRTGGVTRVELLLHNDGRQPANNVFFTASPPEGWNVVFDPSNVDTVAPRDSARVVATIRPAEDAPVGDYSITFTAQGAETHTLDMRVTVNPARWWAVASLLLIVATLAWLRFMFRRYGRR